MPASFLCGAGGVLAEPLCTLRRNDRVSHDKAACELGSRPRDLFQTLRDTVAWLREKGPRAGKRPVPSPT